MTAHPSESRVFVGGSRRVTRLGRAVEEYLTDLLSGRPTILVGDANGADKAFQKSLFKVGYRHVRVFCTEGECRNNLGDWPVTAVTAPRKTRDHRFYGAKDEEMARVADRALMVWDGRSAGTLVNAARMIVLGKPVALYERLGASMLEFTDGAAWQRFVDKLNPELREEIEERLDRRRQDTAKTAQGSLLD